MVKTFSNSFALVFISYIFTVLLTVIFPFLVLLFILVLSLVDIFLALRVSIVSVAALIANQYILSNIIEKIYGYKQLHVYVIGILFYFILYLILRLFSTLKVRMEITIFLILTVFVFFSNTSNILKSTQFIFNVVGGFVGLFILVNSLLKKIKYCTFAKFEILRRDFLSLILLTIFFSFCIMIIDIFSDFIYLKMQAYALSNFRGDGEVVLLNGLPKQYTTAFLNLDFLIRYTSLINEPVRAAYWYLYLLIFLYSLNINKKIKFLLSCILLLFLILCWSKGVFLSIILILIFYFLYKRGKYILSLFFFIIITVIFIYLSGILKTSAVIHVLGLISPFQSQVDFHYFFGHDFYSAGNMGRLDGESWMESVKRGAESLVGTYMYAYGLIGVLLFLLIHYITIKKLNKNRYFMVSSLITVGLFVAFLQEGQYNVMQVYPLCLLVFFLIGNYKFKMIEMHNN